MRRLKSEWRWFYETQIGYGEVDAFIIIVLFSGQEPDLTQSTEQVGNKM